MRPTLLLTLSALCTVACATTKPEEPPPRPREPPGCTSLKFDLETGTLNGLTPRASQAEVKAQLPCSTGDTEDGSPFNYGGGVFFLKNDFYFYTGRDFIEVRTKFTGTLSTPLLGASPSDQEATFGKPKWTEKLPSMLFFDRPWGCLRLAGRGGAIATVAVHYEPCDKTMSWYDD